MCSESTLSPFLFEQFRIEVTKSWHDKMLLKKRPTSRPLCAAITVLELHKAFPMTSHKTLTAIMTLMALD